MSEAPKPWEQAKNETLAAYKAFCCYRDMGNVRNVRDAYKQALGKPNANQASGTFLAWVKQYDWYTRVRAYDAHHEAVRESAKEQNTRESAKAWIERRATLRARVAGVSEQIVERTELLLAEKKKASAFDFVAMANAAKQAAELYDSMAPAGASKADEATASAEFVVFTTTDAPTTERAKDSPAERHIDAPTERSLPLQ